MRMLFAALCTLLIAHIGGTAAAIPSNTSTDSNSDETATQEIANATEVCSNILPPDQCALVLAQGVCESTSEEISQYAKTNCKEACGFCGQPPQLQEEGVSFSNNGDESTMVSRAEATRTYSIIGGSVAGFFLLVFVIAYWRHKHVEMQEDLDSESYYFEPSAHAWVHDMERQLVNADFNAEPAEPQPLTVDVNNIPGRVAPNRTDSPSAYTGYESPNAYSHEYDQVLKKITERSRAAYESDNDAVVHSRSSPLAFYEYSDTEEKRGSVDDRQAHDVQKEVGDSPLSDDEPTDV